FSMAEEFDRHLFIGFQRRYDGNFKELKQQMPQLRPRVIKSCSRDNPSPSLEFLRRSANIFHDMLIHDFDMLINLNGPEPPNTIYTLAHAHDPDTAELADYDTTMVTLKYPSGLMCCIDTSRCAVYGYDQRIEVFGAEGMAIAENQRIHTLQVSTERGTLHAPLDYSFPERYEESYRKEMLHFIEGLHSGSRYNVTLRECLLSHLMVKAAHQSVLQNRPIDFVGEYGAHLSG
ncbi:MAG: Gfo/Idh/MocA family oxidoreductase, partial [Bacteroidota bacterium]